MPGNAAPPGRLRVSFPGKYSPKEEGLGARILGKHYLAFETPANLENKDSSKSAGNGRCLQHNSSQSGQPFNEPWADGSPKTKELTIGEISDTTFKMKDNRQIESIWTRVKE